MPFGWLESTCPQCGRRWPSTRSLIGITTIFLVVALLRLYAVYIENEYGLLDTVSLAGVWGVVGLFALYTIVLHRRRTQALVARKTTDAT